MHLFIDEQLPPGAAVALAAMKMRASTNGDPGCPARHAGASDAEVVAWCLANDAVLVTADRGRGSPEMIELLRKHQVPVVIVKPPGCTARELVGALMKRWDQIADAHDRAQRKGKQTHCLLNPRNQAFSDRRRGV